MAAHDQALRPFLGHHQTRRRFKASTCRVRPMLTAEDVVKRIAAGCAFVETGAPWAFG